MQRFAFFVAFIGLWFFCVSSSAQNPAVQLCVAGMQVSGGTTSYTLGRDLLIKALNKEKQDKAASIQSVPIAPAAPEEALAAAKQQPCDYLVTTDKVESHVDSSWWAGPTAGVNMPVFFVTTAYKLTKVSDGSDMSSGSFKAQDKGSEQNAVAFTMKKIADKVTETIRKAGPITK